MVAETVKEELWQLEHSVEVDVSPSFAWDFRTDIRNWSDPPASCSLDGPFAAGARGTTRMPGQELIHWSVGDVRPGESFLIEVALDRATMRFQWRFDSVSPRRTRLTQRIELFGPNAGTYRQQVEAGFGSNLSAGMQRIAADMVAAEHAARGR